MQICFRPGRPKTPVRTYSFRRHPHVVYGVCILIGFQIQALLHGAGQPRTLSLEEAERTGLTNNWDQRSADRDVSIAEAQRSIAREYANPTFSLATTHIDTHGQNATVLGRGVWERSYDTVLSLSQPIEIGGKRAYRGASTEAGYKSAIARRSDLRRTFVLNITQAYVGASLADEIERLTTESADHLRKEANVANIRFKSGDIAESDLSQIQIAARQLELQARAARTNAVSLRIQLAVLLGYSNPSEIIQLSDSVERLAELPEPQISAREITRADLVAAEQDERKAEAEVHLQKAMRVPDPSVLVQYEHQPPDAPSTVGMGVSFPLPLWSLNRGAIRASILAREQASLTVAKTKAQVSADIASTSKNYEEAASRWTEYKKVIRPQAERVRESVSLAYEKGAASLLDLLQAQRSDNEVRVSAAQAAADTVVAKAALEAAITEFGENSRNHS